MLEWSKTTSKNTKGVIVASDQKQEWLLPWWWGNYSKYNAFPVTFINLGLSKEAQEFCKEKGELLDIQNHESILLSLKNQLGKETTFSQDSISLYESQSLDKRLCWHQKPLAMLETPYLHTLWLDLDCEVRACLSPLFEQIVNKDAILICPEHIDIQERLRKQGELAEDEFIFNSGVIGFTKGSSYILQWAQSTLKEASHHLGDQNLLSKLLYIHKWQVEPLDPLYNWHGSIYEIPPQVKIIHWAGETGKLLLSLQSSVHFTL